MDIPNAGEVHHLLCVQGDLVSRGNAQFHKEVFVTGDASMGPNNIIQVLGRGWQCYNWHGCSVETLARC